MARVFLHTRKPGGADWLNESREFHRIPAVSEYLTRETDGPWYQVQLVVHTPFPCDCDAEVYAVEVDHLAEQAKAFPDFHKPSLPFGWMK